ncbi:unnamed protein product [Cuscuta epithymum]|jgi:hypothetical protein
MVMA